ncbi:MAG TPA: terminase family protein [Sphingopyxis sp.]|nr:terminase family protein [Sphingopyxis sp.]
MVRSPDAPTPVVPIPAIIPYDARRLARAYYWRGWDVAEIAKELGLSANTVGAWKTRDKWDEDPVIRRIEDSCEMRLNQLIFKDKKSGTDFKEIDLLGRQIERMARVRRYGEEGGHEGDLNPNIGSRNKGERKRKPKNLITPEDAAKLREAMLDMAFGYQEKWWSNLSRKTRFLLKSRQIGATFWFALEALVRGLETGNNQIFISASRAQANNFRSYIWQFVLKVLEIDLKGEHLTISRGEDADGNVLEPFTMYFLGTNYRTAQSYHGDVYIDEVFWIHGFDQIDTVASAMAAQKFYHITYFSTPSTINHEAYKKWSGEWFNEGRPKNERVKIDISHKALKDGQLGEDRIWRHFVSIKDAEAAGCDLFDLEDLQFRYSVDQFANLFMCEFVDDSQSSFPMAMIRPAMVDSWDVWKDYQPYGLRPYGNGEVWIGYDPAESEDGDSASAIVVAPPTKPGGKFRVLEKLAWRGKDYEAQAKEIRKLMSRYNVTEIAIDGTGMGSAVFQLVVKFFPRARRINYSAHIKSEMVLKAKNVFTRGRIEFDAGWTDLAQALMSIHPQLTRGGGQMTYVARRSAATGHGDMAWALLHALSCEPLDANDGGSKKSTVEINR